MRKSSVSCFASTACRARCTCRVAKRALRGLLVARRQLVSARTKLCNVVRGMLRQEGIRLPARALSSFVGWRRIQANGFEQAHLPVVVVAYFDVFTSLTHSIREIETQLAEREETDSRVAKLKTIPRVGRIASLTFLARVDDVHRFSSSRKLVGYSGLAQRLKEAAQETIAAATGNHTELGRQRHRLIDQRVSLFTATEKGRPVHASDGHTHQR